MNGYMASACATSSCPVVPVAPAAWASSACPSKKSTAARICRRRRSVSCRASGGDEDSLLWLPRREVLAAGLTGVASLAGYPGLASALEAELTAPCRKGDKVNDKLVECTDPLGGKIPCPPLSTGPIIDFKPEAAVKRVRQPAHLLSRENQEKYKEALAKMKALPASHPLSFAEQAAIHEAYCDGHYRYDPTEKNRPFDVHFSWIFAPWHRMYIYFYERALGQLIGDDTFALPYWNWDAPSGMVVPPIFRDPQASNALYDPNRDPAHLDKLVNLDFLKSRDAQLKVFDGPQDDVYKQEVYKNLCTVYQQQVRAGKGARAFLGEKLCSETSFRTKEINERSKRRQDGNAAQLNKTKSQGTLERMAHTAMHVWVGKPGAKVCNASDGVLTHDGSYSCSYDMGFLGSAGRDPLFYSHHANVDRMWHLWAKLGGRGFNDSEWLDAAFVFYDGVDNPRRVRIKFRDVLDTRNLGYTYDAESEKDLPWLDCKLTPLVPHGKDRAPRPSPAQAAAFPVTLKKDEVVEVPGVAVPPAQPGQERVLLIEGIEYDPKFTNKFDVAINVPKESAKQVGPQHSEYAGSFSVVPSSKDGGGKLEGKVSLYIDGVLADLEADGVSTVDVVLVPRSDDDITLYYAPTIQNQD